MLQRRCDLVLVIKAEQTEVLSITADIEIEIVDKRLCFDKLPSFQTQTVFAHLQNLDINLLYINVVSNQ